MTVELSRYRYSLTCRTEDEAVLYCLRALWRYAEEETTILHLQADDRTGWRARDGELVLRFSSEQRRGDFLGEATRLLAGHWWRLAMSDDDPA